MKTIGLVGGMSWESTLATTGQSMRALKRGLGGCTQPKLRCTALISNQLRNYNMQVIGKAQRICLGKIESDSKAQYLRIINTLAFQGAQAVILGCTEIGMLVNQTDTHVRPLDTTAIHAGKTVAFATT